MPGNNIIVQFTEQKWQEITLFFNLGVKGMPRNNIIVQLKEQEFQEITLLFN